MRGGRFSRPLLDLWRRRKRATFPTGAVVWHLEAWRSPALSVDQRVHATSLRQMHGFDQLWIVHGGAIARAGHCFVLSGPAGIGKSSALLALERAGEGEIAEDGLLLLGRAAEGWQLVRTGTLPFMRTSTAIARLLRRASALDVGTLWRNDGHAEPSSRSLLRFDEALAAGAFRLAVMTHRRDKKRAFVSATMPVGSVLHIAHPRDPYPPVRVEPDGGLIADRGLFTTASGLPGMATVSPSLSREELREVLRATLPTRA